MTSPIDDLKERLEKLLGSYCWDYPDQHLVDFCRGAIRLAEAYREVPTILHQEECEGCSRNDDDIRRDTDEKVQEILKTSREG